MAQACPINSRKLLVVRLLSRMGGTPRPLLGLQKHLIRHHSFPTPKNEI